MQKEFWGALVDAAALIISLLVAHFLESSLADLIVKVVAAAQPVVVIVLVKMYADRKAAEVGSAIAQVKAEVAQALRQLRKD